MSLSLACSCGARFEVEDTFAGHTVTCPECQCSLRTPSLRRTPLRTSGYAVASVVLALTLTFTIVGTALAVILGFFALVSIARHRDQVAGAGYAVFGIAWGLVFTGVTLFAYSKGELFGVDRIRELSMSAEVDRSGPLEIVREKDGFAITRPSEKWGVARPELERRISPGTNLTLANIGKDSYLSVTAEFVGPVTLAKCRENVLASFRDAPDTNVFGKGTGKVKGFKVRESRRLPAVGGAGVEEMVLDLREMGQARTYLVRVVKDDRTNRLYTLSGWTQARRFAAMQPEFQNAMGSFRLLGR